MWWTCSNENAIKLMFMKKYFARLPSCRGNLTTFFQKIRILNFILSFDEFFFRKFIQWYVEHAQMKTQSNWCSWKNISRIFLFAAAIWQLFFKKIVFSILCFYLTIFFSSKGLSNDVWNMLKWKRNQTDVHETHAKAKRRPSWFYPRRTRHNYD